MNPKEYIEAVKRTESMDFEKIALRLSDKRTIRLLHAAIGLSTEANEFLDAMKKHIFYGKEIDRTNLIEELGDGNWYEGIAIDELETSFQEIMERNIEKLHKRYGISFNEEEAITRNLSAERYILENDNTTHFISCLKQIDSTLDCTCDSVRKKITR